jgi:predicted outer membrane lipoprotein
MKAALWILGSLLVADLVFLSHFYLIRADYYFPGRYEDAFAATFYALLLGLPVLGAFVAISALYLTQARSTPKCDAQNISSPET